MSNKKCLQGACEVCGVIGEIVASQNVQLRCCKIHYQRISALLGSYRESEYMGTCADCGKRDLVSTNRLHAGKVCRSCLVSGYIDRNTVSYGPGHKIPVPEYMKDGEKDTDPLFWDSADIMPYFLEKYGLEESRTEKKYLDLQGITINNFWKR